jgi:lipopolysaccharide export system permease protein
MFGFRRIERYIFFQTLFGVLVAAGGVCLSIILVDVVEQLRNVAGSPSAGTLTALKFTLMRTPGILELALPFAVLVGSIVTFMNLSRRSEVVAMRASGVSTWRFLSPVAMLAVLVGLFSNLILGPAAAKLNLEFERQLTAVTSMSATLSGKGDKATLWFNDRGPKEHFAVSATQRAGETYRNVTLFSFSTVDSRFIARYDAQSAVRTPNSWTLSDVTETAVGAPTRAFAKLRFALIDKATTDDGKSVETAARAIPIWGLPAAARAAEASGGSPQRYWLQFHRKMALPIALLSMAMIAAVLSLSSDRMGNQALMAAGAIAAGLLVYFINDISGALATAGYAPSWMAAWCPPLATLFIALATVSYREDG